MKKPRKKKSNVPARAAAHARAREEIAKLPTANAKVIKQVMIEHKVGGHYKDYVVIAGKCLMDWRGSFNMLADDGKTVGVNGMALVHKSKLASVVGADTAKLFWRPGIGRVGLPNNAGKPT
jgi:hypothetical protein